MPKTKKKGPKLTYRDPNNTYTPSDNMSMEDIERIMSLQGGFPLGEAVVEDQGGPRIYSREGMSQFAKQGSEYGLEAARFLPFVGEALDAGDIASAARTGKDLSGYDATPMGRAGMLAAGLLIPNLIEKPIKAAYRVLKNLKKSKLLKTLDTGRLKVGGESILDLPKLPLKKRFNESLERADDFSQDFYGDPNIEKHFTDMYGGVDAKYETILNDPIFKQRRAFETFVNRGNISSVNLDKIRKLDNALASKYPREDIWVAQDSFKFFKDGVQTPGNSVQSVFKKGKKGELEKGFNVRTEEGLVNSGGHYNPNNNKTFVNENDGVYDPKWAESTGVHELNHKATVQFIQSPSGQGARESLSDFIKSDLADVTRSGQYYGLVDGKATPEYIASAAEVTARVQQARHFFRKMIDNPHLDWDKIYTGNMSQIENLDPGEIARLFLKNEQAGVRLSRVLRGTTNKAKVASLINLFKVSPVIAGAAAVTAVNASGEETSGGLKLLKGGKVRLLKK